MPDNNKHQNGYVLLAVISILTIAAIIAAIAVSNTRLEAKIVRTDLDNTKVRGGINTAIARAVFLVGEEGGLIADGRVLNFELDDMSYKVRLVDDRGLVGLNSANGELLEKVIELFAPSDTDARSLADNILDWRDADSDPRPLGAEARVYESQGLPPPANRSFVHIAELGRVLGVNEQVYAALAPIFSVSSKLPSPDQNFAPLVILNLLDMSPSEISRIIDARQSLQQTSLQVSTLSNTEAEPPVDRQEENADIYHAFVEVSTNNNVHRAERLLVRLNLATAQYDLYARQVINYGASNYLFEETVN